MRIIDNYRAIVFDVQMTFMFGVDRFDEGQDYYATYKEQGGNRLGSDEVHRAISRCVDHLWPIYQNPDYFDDFPSLRQAFAAACPWLDPHDPGMAVLERTFALHERGHVPREVADCLRGLARTHRLGLVSNIWAKKDVWLEEFRAKGIHDIFEVMVFSSDHRCIKPSPALFEIAVKALALPKYDILFVGDNPAYDVVGAKAAGLDVALTTNGAAFPQGISPEPDYVISSVLDLAGASEPSA